MEIKTNNSENNPVKITWQELEDQCYSPINHIMKPTFDWDSIPEDKQDLVNTVIKAEMDAVDIEQEEAQRAEVEQAEKVKDEVRTRLEAIKKSSGEIATKQFIAVASAEAASSPITVRNGALITEREREEILAGDRDAR